MAFQLIFLRGTACLYKIKCLFYHFMLCSTYPTQPNLPCSVRRSCKFLESCYSLTPPQSLEQQQVRVQVCDTILNVTVYSVQYVRLYNEASETSLPISSS